MGCEASRPGGSGDPNWLDTEGRTTGQIEWRIMLPEADVETPQAELVALASRVA